MLQSSSSCNKTAPKPLREASVSSKNGKPKLEQILVPISACQRTPVDQKSIEMEEDSAVKEVA